MNTTTTYQQYTTAFKICAVMSEEQTYVREMVPASTIAYWKTQDFKEYLGFELEKQLDKNKQVFNAIVRNKRYAEVCRGLLIMLSLSNTLIDSVKNKKSLLRKNKELLIETFDALKKYFTVSTIEKRLNITASKISRWKAEGKCALSSLKLCLTLNPMQLTIDEQLILKNYLLDESNKHVYTNHIWAKAQREGLMIADATAYKYSNEIFGKKMRVKNDKNKISIHADFPFQILHMDTTSVVLPNKEKVYIHFIMDNFSRAVLGGVVSHSSKSSVVVENLREVMKKYNLFYKPFILYCDGGPENEGDVNCLLGEGNIRIEKIIANYLDETTNNMAEAWHRKFKQLILKEFEVKNSQELIEQLPEMISFANNLFLPVLKTLTPNEVLSGMKYEDLNVPEKMAEAKRKRIQTNRAFNCKEKCNGIERWFFN